MLKQTFYLLTAVCFTAVSSLPTGTKPIPTENYAYSKELDPNGNYFLYWKFNKTHITFETHVRTRGYVGLGLATKAKMFPADIVIGWVKDGKTHLTDRHSVGHYEPVIDKSQDWHLLHGEENDFGTVLKMVRKLDTCDDDDYKIVDETVRILYSYHPDDPASETGLPYHGVTNRGAKSALLLSNLKTPQLPSNVMTRDLIHNGFAVPSDDTTYQCKVVDMSNFGGKHHMIKFEAIVQKGHESLVHHIILYKCPGTAIVGDSYPCYRGSRNPHQVKPCGSVFLAWAIGGEPFYFPDNVGIPIGESGDNSAYVMEVHYNNPGRRNDFVDNSGFRITYTPTLRQHDGGMLMTGVIVSSYQIIPPYEEAFLSTGFCTEDCINKGMPTNTNNVTVFAVLQHGHLVAKAIKTRLIRNGIEQAPLADDHHYDFDYQDYMHLHKTRTLQKGDSIITECTYDTSKKTTVTEGGLSTSEEMCLTFIFHYPRMKLDTCRSVPLYDDIPFNLTNGRPDQSALHTDWTSKHTRDKFKDYIAHSTYEAECKGTRMNPQSTYPRVPVLKPRVPYVPPQSLCHAQNQSVTTSHAGNAGHTAPTTATSVNQFAAGTLNPTAKATPTEDYPFHTQVDTNGNYLLYWKFNQTHITFEVHARTRGYVGFGLSPNGDMYPADVVIGWIKDGKTYFKDRHTVAHAEPLIDASQDWILLHGEENHFGTVLKMARKLDTCDADDFKITKDTLRVIYSYHPDDPHSETGLPYHGATNRGAKSLMLLSLMKAPRMPHDLKTRDLLKDQYHVPSDETTYQCKVFDLSDIGGKNHLIKFEPVIQKGHEALVHHMLLYKCPSSYRKYLGRSYVCYHDNSIPAPCGNIALAWATGGEAFYFPEDAGLPIGETSDHDVYILETHYNNPGRLSDFVDSSGFRLTYTPTLRQHDAGILTTGMSVNRYQIVPPHEKAFISTGFCTADCINKGLKSKTINVFAVLHHAHLLGEAIRTRHIRNGTEIEPLADDQHYDFDFQEYRHIHPPKKIVPGDSVIVECTYDSTHKTQPTFGGLETKNEMCLSFLVYYPRMELESCQSHPTYDNIHVPYEQVISRAQQYDWTTAHSRDAFKKLLNESTNVAHCIGLGWHRQQTNEVLKVPYPRTSYTPPPSACNSHGGN